MNPILDDYRFNVMLLTLSTYARKKHSDLRDPSIVQCMRYPSEDRTKPQMLRLRLLRDLANCNVRNREVAAACSGSAASIKGGSVSCKDSDDKFGDLTDFSDFTQIFIASNPDSTDSERPPPGQDIIQIPGQAYWPSILDNPWQYLASTDPSHGERLANHAATLAEYLNACMTNPQAKSKFFEQFSQYLAASCWPKVYKWMTHWASTGFHYFLARYTKKDLLLTFDAGFSEEHLEDSPKRRDAALAEYFLEMKKMRLLTSIMKEHPNPALHTSQFPHLTAAFEKVVSSEITVHIYNRETCLEFHQFLVALLCAYTTSLEALQCQPSKSLGLAFYNLAIVLWKVARSQILLIHLRTLDGAIDSDLVAVTLGMPNDGHKVAYKNFFKSLQGRSTGETKVEREEQQDGENEENGDREGLDDEESVYDDLLEETRLEDSGFRVATFNVYLKWFDLLPPHAASLDRLTEFYLALSRQLGVTKMGIQLVSVGYRESVLLRRDLVTSILGLAEPDPDPESEPSPPPIDLQFQSRARAPFTRAQAEIIAEYLKQLISKRDSYGSSSIISKFRAENGPLFIAQVHCETTLAAFMKYRHLANCDTLPDFNDSAIGVCKLSCPPCAAFMTLSRGGDCGPIFHGTHPTIFPVDLPYWIPDTVLADMQSRVRSSLVAELSKLYRYLKRPQSAHTNDASLQSEGSYCSTTSTENNPPLQPSK